MGSNSSPILGVYYDPKKRKQPEHQVAQADIIFAAAAFIIKTVRKQR